MGDNTYETLAGSKNHMYYMCHEASVNYSHAHSCESADSLLDPGEEWDFSSCCLSTSDGGRTGAWEWADSQALTWSAGC